MRALLFALLVGFVTTTLGANPSYVELNDLDKSVDNAVGETNLLATGKYDVVVYIGDSYTRLPDDLRSIGDAIAAFMDINKGAGNSLGVIPFPEHDSRKLIWASTGDLSSDIASSRDIRLAAEGAMHRVVSLGFKRVLLVVGPMQTAFHSFKWAKGDYPKMTASLGAFHALYKPLQVREMSGADPKVTSIGLYGFSEDLVAFVKAVAYGMGVTRDIGDSDPERTRPLKIVEYLNARKPSWAAAGITFTVEDVIDNKARYPMAYAVNRATESSLRHRGQVVRAEYMPSGSFGETVILVGKGVALDTGGADLKINGGMYGMHNDKLGAAFVAGFFETLSRLKPTGLKVIGYMPYIRNSLGKYAYLPDEIVTLVNGLRVRIGNTDAEGRNIMADVLHYAKEDAKKEVNPHIYTIATLTGAASRSFGPYTATMDNGPAADIGKAFEMMEMGDCIGDPTEVTRIRYEDFSPNMPISEWEDIEQYNTNPGATSKRGYSFPMGYLQMVSQIDKHGRNSGHPIKYTHCDIAGSGGGINELATAAPLRMFALDYLWPLKK